MNTFLVLVLTALLSLCSNVNAQSDPELVTFPPIDEKQFPELNSPELNAEAAKGISKRCSAKTYSKWLNLNKRQYLAYRFLRSGEDEQDAEKRYELFRKARILDPEMHWAWLYEAQALKSLGKLDEAMDLIGKAPANADIDFNLPLELVALKTEILIDQKKYQEALSECDNLQIGSPLGKPFYSGRRTLYGQLYQNHVLRSRIYALTNRPAEAAREAGKAWYLSMRQGKKDAQVLGLMHALNLAVPTKLVPITTDNEVAFQMMDHLLQLNQGLSREEAETIFKRPMFQERGRWGSTDERQTFSSVRGWQDGQQQTVAVELNAERVFITRADLEMHFGQAVYIEAGKSGCIVWGASETFRREDRAIEFQMPGPVLEFTVYPRNR